MVRNGHLELDHRTDLFSEVGEVETGMSRLMRVYFQNVT